MLKPVGVPVRATSPQARGVRDHLDTYGATVREDGDPIPLYDKRAPPLEICSEASVETNKVVGARGGAHFGVAKKIEHPPEKQSLWVDHLPCMVEKA